MSDTIDVQAPMPSPQNPGQERTVSKRGRRLLLAIIIVLVLALVGISLLLLNYIAPRNGVAGRDESNGVTWVRSIYGWGRAPGTQLTAPTYVSISDDSKIWVSDINFKTVISFTPEGKLAGQYGTKLQQVIGFAGVTVGPENAVYAEEPAGDRVRVVSSTDQDLGLFSVPNPVSIAYRDNLMVVGSKSGIAIVDPNTGKPEKLIGSFGRGLDQFDTVKGIAIGPDKTIYATDTYNNRIVAYRPDGKRMWSVRTGAPRNKVDVEGADAMAASTVSTSPADLQLPSGITVDGNGRVVVVDPFDFSIAVLDGKNGKFIAKYGANGEKDGQFMYPSSIAYDPRHDWFAVADTGNHRVQLIRIPGSSSLLSPASAVRRAFTGPLRACLVPLILLILLVIAFIITKARRKKVAEATVMEPEIS